MEIVLSLVETSGLKIAFPCPHSVMIRKSLFSGNAGGLE